MFKKIFLIIICGVFFGGCSLVPKKSGLEVISNLQAKVYIDGKEMGTTPYKNNSLFPKEIEVKIKTQNNQEWSKKIELQNNSNTVVNWEFGNEEKESGGYVISLEKTGDNKKAGIIVNVTPDKATVAIDGEIKGFSPLRIDDIGDGDKQVTISFPGNKSINIFIRAIKGYQTILESKLAEEKIIVQQEENNQQNNLTEKQNETIITIKETETGWLRVRESSSNASKEIVKINPGEKYKLLEENKDWYQIDLGENKTGWISAKYAEKNE